MDRKQSIEKVTYEIDPIFGVIELKILKEPFEIPIKILKGQLKSAIIYHLKMIRYNVFL